VGMIVGTIVGTLLPILMRSLKIDPAIISSPLITIINGIVIVATFFGVGLLLF
jgi:magnesium transporter